MTVPVVAIFRAKPGHEETVEAMFHGVIETTLAEEGCIAYQLNRDTADPARFVWIEEWETLELLEQHLAATHIKELFANLPDFIESSDVIKLMSVAGGKA